VDYVTSFAKFGNVLIGGYQTNWKQVLHEHFLVPVDPEVVKPAQDHALAENFLHAINLFLIRTLNKKKYPGIASTITWHLVGTIASTRSSSQAFWTISIASRRCSALQSFYPREIILRPMLLYRLSGFLCHFIAWIM
jgi:hypothetical protein